MQSIRNLICIFPYLEEECLPINLAEVIFADSSEEKELQVLHYSPEGDLQIAPNLTVTFSHPMCAVSTLSQVEAQTVPVKLEPQPEGRWKFLGI